MKRLFTVVICLTLSHFTKASVKFEPYQPVDSGNIGVKRDTLFVPVVKPLAYSPYKNVFKLRLDSIQKQVPLNYNEYVQAYIDGYTVRKNDIGRMLGLAKYYFPIYEKAFREAGIPEEIKFLSIVESELNPNAVSRVGATGPWQFMYATGRNFGLAIDDYVDERRDPIQASYAAAAYLKDAYQEFGDWLLAIASYNCGKSSVERAIAQAGALDFWSIRQYLPVETRGYVPAYIAVSYIMNFYNKHSIIAQACSFNTKTDTVMVNRMVSINNIAQTLGVDARELALLNPAYKRGLINGTIVAPRRMIVPKIAPDKYSVLYESLNSDGLVNPAAQAAYMAANLSDHRLLIQKPAYHTVKRNETVEDIADRYGVEVQDLEAWNNLHYTKLVTGTRLRLSQASANDNIELKKNPKKYLTYKVRKGDTLTGLADKFDASIDSIKELNGLKKNKLQPGTTLRFTKV